MARVRKRVRIKWENVVMAFILFICFVVICICVFSIFGRYLDKNQIMRQVKSINDTVLVREYADNDKVELVGSTFMDNID